MPKENLVLPYPVHATNGEKSILGKVVNFLRQFWPSLSDGPMTGFTEVGEGNIPARKLKIK